MSVICNDIGCSAKMLTYFSLIDRPHFYIDTTLVDFSMSRFFLKDATQMYQFFFTAWWCNFFPRTPLPVGISMSFLANARKRNWYTYLFLQGEHLNARKRAET